MGFLKTNGRWTRKSERDVGTADVEAGAHSSSEGEPSARHTSPGPSCPTPPAPASATPVQPSVSFSDAQLDQIKSLLSAHKEELKNELNGSLVSLNELLYSVDVKVSKIQSELASSLADLKDDLEEKFDDLKVFSGNVEIKEKLDSISTTLEKKLEDLVKISSEEMKKYFDDLRGK